MKKIFFLLLIIATLNGFAQKPGDAQIRYALTQFGKNLKDRNIKNILSMVDESMRISDYTYRLLPRAIPNLVLPLNVDTIYFDDIKNQHDKIYARQVTKLKNGQTIKAWLRMNRFLSLERVGFFEYLVNHADPVKDELGPAKLLDKFTVIRAGGLVFLEARINGSKKKYTFLFDSGAGATTLSQDAATELGIKANKNTADIKTASGSAQLKTIDTSIIDIGTIHMIIPGAVLSDLKGLSHVLNMPMDGIIGYDFLKNYQVAVDLDNNQMSVYTFGTLTAKKGQQILPINVTTNTPRIPVNLNVKGISYAGTLLFDTGSSSSISANYFMNTYMLGLSGKLEHVKNSASMDLSGQVTKSQVGLIDAITVAGLNIQHPSVTLELPTSQPPYGFEKHGLIGMSLISRFNLIFNYSLGYISLTPNKKFNTPVVPLYLLSMGISNNNGKFILSADEEGTAYKNGIRKGDQLISINGIHPTTTDQITQQLRALGQGSVELEVDRNNEKVKLVLEKLNI